MTDESKKNTKTKHMVKKNMMARFKFTTHMTLHITAISSK